MSSILPLTFFAATPPSADLMLPWLLRLRETQQQQQQQRRQSKKPGIFVAFHCLQGPSNGAATTVLTATEAQQQQSMAERRHMQNTRSPNFCYSARLLPTADTDHLKCRQECLTFGITRGGGSHLKDFAALRCHHVCEIHSREQHDLVALLCKLSMLTTLKSTPK
jgi:hypothetical protein